VPPAELSAVRAPVQAFHGAADEEVSPRRCGELVERSKTEGGAVEIRFYPGASHSFDDPGTKRQAMRPTQLRRKTPCSARCGSLPINCKGPGEAGRTSAILTIQSKDEARFASFQRKGNANHSRRVRHFNIKRSPGNLVQHRRRTSCLVDRDARRAG
jgi:Dienelactone hydrolase family